MFQPFQDPIVHHPSRHPPLKGGINFRDLGGYATADGGRVKWQKLFRSGHLAKLTAEDHAQLEQFGVGAVCDFRTDWENEHQASHLPEHLLARMVRFNIWPSSARTVEDMIKGLSDGSVTDAEVYEVQNAVYREFVTEFSDRYAGMFRHILAAEGKSVLIHCAGGKDRTGLGSALLHVALGVPEATIHEDYALTNANPMTRRYIRIVAERAAKRMGVTDQATIDGLFDRFMPLFGARNDSLQAAFDAIQRQAGSFDGYFTKVLNVSDADRAKLRQWYVEKP